jgi:hypothetical protein
LRIVLTKPPKQTRLTRVQHFRQLLAIRHHETSPARVEFGAAWLAPQPWPALPSVPICDGAAVGETRAEAVDALKPYPHGPLAIRRARRHHNAPAPPVTKDVTGPLRSRRARQKRRLGAQSVSMPAAQSPNEIKPATRCDTLPSRLQFTACRGPYSRSPARRASLWRSR